MGGTAPVLLLVFVWDSPENSTGGFWPLERIASRRVDRASSFMVPSNAS